MLTIEMFLHIIKSFAPKLTQNLFKFVFRCHGCQWEVNGLLYSMLL